VLYCTVFLAVCCTVQSVIAMCLYCTEADEGSMLYKLKRRFLKDQTQSRVYFARKYNKLKDMREVGNCSITTRHVTLLKYCK